MGSSSLCIPTLKLAATSIASQKASPSCFSPKSTPPLCPDCFNMNSEAKQSTDPGQSQVFFCSGGQFQHPSHLWTGSLCKCLQKQQEKDGTGPEVNCQGLIRAEPLDPKAALMFASTEWLWDTLPQLQERDLHKERHLINPNGNVISTQIPQLQPGQGWKPQTQNSARQMQKLKENIYKKKDMHKEC